MFTSLHVQSYLCDFPEVVELNLGSGERLLERVHLIETAGVLGAQAAQFVLQDDNLVIPVNRSETKSARNLVPAYVILGE